MPQGPGCSPGKDVNIDHVYPRSKAKLLQTVYPAWNMVWTHVRCNTDKGDRMPTEAEILFLKNTTEAMLQILPTVIYEAYS